MNEFKKELLQRISLADIVEPGDISDIISYLQSKGVLTDEEVYNIRYKNQNQKENLIKHLLLKNDGPWFEEFINALRESFSWIAEGLEKQFLEKRRHKIAFYLGGNGNVPPLPHHNVQRHDLVVKLREKIRALKRDYFFVVHGMSGWGKTCSVISALHDIDLLETSLDGHVYWMSVGDLRNDEPDDLQCSQLQKKLCDMLKLPVNTQQDLLLQLKRHFSLEPNYSALLVLDKVRSPKVVDALNVGCKILVTTQDCDVVKRYTRKEFFPIEKGFSEKETVQLLQNFVPGVLRSSSIKECALKIHHAWKGHPMVIGLIGGELSEMDERSQKNLTRWQEYASTAPRDDENNISRRRSIVDEQISSFIDSAVQKLPGDLRICFTMLAVFVEDANITPDVLKILWDLPENTVLDIMNQFYKRSLVFKRINSNLNAIVYGIHDIIMKDLKKNIPNSDLKNMHRNLIWKYKKKCSDKFENLPRDSYIYSYLCHHIENAMMWEELVSSEENPFFSLHYIESKIKATSPGDLLLDLSKYKDGLTGNIPEYLSKLEEIKKFVKFSGWDIYQDEIDVVQGALLQPKESYIFKEGSKLAIKNDPCKVYLLPKESCKGPENLEWLQSNVSCVSIILNNSIHYPNARVLIYIDDKSNKFHILEVDMHYRQIRRSFEETSSVQMIRMSPNCDRFLSALHNGCVNVWSLACDGAYNADTPPPSLRQKELVPPETRTTPSASYRHQRRVTSACFSSDGKLVLSTSEDSTIIVWNLEEHKEVYNLLLHPVSYATSCAFMCEDTVIAYASAFKIYFVLWMKSKNYFEEVDVDQKFGNIVSLLSVTEPDRKLICIQERGVHLFSSADQILMHRTEGLRPEQFLHKRLDLLYENQAETITCAVYQSHQRLLLGTKSGCHLFVDVFNQRVPACSFGSGEVRAVDMIGSCIAFAQMNYLKMCWHGPDFKPATKELPSTNASHLGWTERNVSVYCTATSNGKIQVYHDGKLSAEKFLPKTCIVRLSTFDSKVLIGTYEGEVQLLDTVSSKVETLLEPSSTHFPKSEIKYLSAGMYRNTPCYLIAVRSITDESYTLQIINDKKCGPGLKVDFPVVKTFFCTRHRYILAVLSNYSILAYCLQNENSFVIQEGRDTAKVTDACLSLDENVLVLSDEENCFHVISLTWPEDNNNFKNGTRKPAPSRSCLTLQVSNHHYQPRDEVDGVRMSSVASCDLKSSLNSHSLLSPSWCCSICQKGELIAIGYDDCKVLIFDQTIKREICEFDVLPSRQTKVGQVWFSPYNVKLGRNQYKLVLFVFTDCLSLWNLSPCIEDNIKKSSGAIKDKPKPKRIGCVNAGGNPLSGISISSSFTKYSAVDMNGSYFLWEPFEN